MAIGSGRGTEGRRARSLRAVVAGSALVLAGSVAAACGSSPAGSSGASSSKTTTAPTSAPSPTTTAVSAPTATTASDVALANAELLPTSAYPAGWQSQGPSSTNTQASFFGGAPPSGLATMAHCLGIDASTVDPNPAEAAAPEYDDPNSNVTVTESVEVYPTAAAAAVDVHATASPKAPACMTSIIGNRMSRLSQQGMTVGNPTITSVSVPTFGSGDGAFMVTFPFTYQGVSGTMHMETIAIQKGRSEAVLQFSDSQAPPSATVDQLATAAAASLQAG